MNDPGDVQVEHVFTTRAGGVSTGPYESLNLGLHVGDDPAAVIENRRRAAALLDGATLDDLVFCNQTHGRVVVEVGNADKGRGTRSVDDAIPGADALVTRTSGVVLAVMVADCVPILLADADAGVIAAVHAGWRGTTADVVGATVAVMTALGASPDRIVAELGPAIPPERYQVGPDVALAATEADVAIAALGPDPEPQRWRFDLWAANAVLLQRAGVRPEHIGRTGAVPSGGDGPYFSDRGERPCGRFALLARIKPEP